MIKYLLIMISLVSLPLIGQISQTVKGSVVDSESQYPLIGARLTLVSSDSSVIIKNMTDMDGLYNFQDVPIGKYQLITSYNSYLNSYTTVTVNSGRESIINVQLNEDILTTEEINIVGKKIDQLNNEMATISARQFSVEETERYAGSRGDPARMSSNFAGVQGADDSRNDIVVRGNSPIGVLWKVEGIDLPNPNHFATSGSTGGPVAILNNKILANSDFFMSAFPADYGNSISAVFDLKLRNGNTDKHEFTGQFGFLGTEALAEGPINRDKRSSYLVMGRYSTLSIFQSMNIRIGTDAVPVYGDGAFKLSFPLKKGGHLGVFGIGGASDIDIVISDQKEVSEEAFGEGDRDQYFGTAMGVVGVSYKKPISRNTFFKATIAQSYDQQQSRHDFLIRSLDTLNSGSEPTYEIRTDSIFELFSYKFKTYKTALYASINHKINNRNLIRAGLNVDGYYMENIDSALDVTKSFFETRHDYKGFSMLVQPFVQYKLKVNEKMDFTAGLHSQYFSLSDSWSYAEPRLGWQWRLNNGHQLSAGAGMHSQMQPTYQYTYQQSDAQGDLRRLNEDMDFTRSFHSAIGYQKNFKGNLSLKSEVYYQYLYNIPVDMYASSFSLINQGSGFQRFFPDELVNEGTGTNYGVEVTVQKFFNKSFFFLATGSLFESKYKGSDGIERDTDFNGNYALNFLAGKEIKINDKSKISAGFKITAAGGRRYGYVDIAQTEINSELVFKDSLFNTRQFQDYFRLDFKVTYVLNTEKLTHEIGLDLVNILNTENILALSYAPNLIDPTQEPIAERYQLGFLPIFYYKVDFSFSKGSRGNSR
ncbi:TonB-dependent receptor [Brumimicrobium mesophilum]|uniref:TonB-dependent receptor n=1 Tax=Brumimicrobium mesophilum TaxID=392717 RepID=UPI00131CD0F1|nr:TonB-dependent receptor [Brumimicrobium mesophilum]